MSEIIGMESTPKQKADKAKKAFWEDVKNMKPKLKAAMIIGVDDKNQLHINCTVPLMGHMHHLLTRAQWKIVEAEEMMMVNSLEAEKEKEKAPE